MRIWNFGSLNVDYVYQVDHAVLPGETLSSTGRDIFCGGKGLNQSLGLARGGAQVMHVGCTGDDGDMLRDMLESNGVDISLLKKLPGPGGHTFIQVDKNGQNSILLFPGTNHALTPELVDEALSQAQPGDMVLLQNETSSIPYIMKQAAARGLETVWNPSPCPQDVEAFPLEAVSTFAVNELEGAAIAGCAEPEAILDTLRARFPHVKVLLTLGSRGSCYDDGTRVYADCVKVQAVDTTAAGDTFLGFFLANRDRIGPQAALKLASAAAAMAVTVAGAANSIPTLAAVLEFCRERGIKLDDSAVSL